jgi:chromatin remodeling complex protein RSC6
MQHPVKCDGLYMHAIDSAIHCLQDPADRRYTVCDDTLRELTGETRFLSFGFMKHLNKHLIKT